ncbi:hypothetical protein GCM10008967_21480 [Bacillus carboniphilus]|uniref:SpoVT-AbrB domain-containing protein n=1 Tax=Bacillus carboniphilus TaxID=86663 RepID=A0ABN0WA78_9BACI
MTIIKKIDKNGQITIPKDMLRELNFKDGLFVSVYRRQHLIIIEQKVNDAVSQCVLRNGRVSVPVELRYLLKIDNFTRLEVNVCLSTQKVFIKPLLQ